MYKTLAENYDQTMHKEACGIKTNRETNIAEYIQREYNIPVVSMLFDDKIIIFTNVIRDDFQNCIIM